MSKCFSGLPSESGWRAPRPRRSRFHRPAIATVPTTNPIQLTVTRESVDSRYTSLGRSGLKSATSPHFRNGCNFMAPDALGSDPITPRSPTMTWRSLGFALSLVFLSYAPVNAQTPITGIASVIDGDTIEIHGQRIRLFGIDAPESGQLCVRPTGERWRCGQQASFA